MSQSRAIGIILATGCGVFTAFSTFAPELQKQQQEREQAHFNVGPTNTVESQSQHLDQAPAPTVISNDDSIGASVKDTIAETKQEVKSNTSWPGLSFFKWSYEGAASAKPEDGRGGQSSQSTTAGSEKP